MIMMIIIDIISTEIHEQHRFSEWWQIDLGNHDLLLFEELHLCCCYWVPLITVHNNCYWRELYHLMMLSFSVADFMHMLVHTRSATSFMFHRTK